MVPYLLDRVLEHGPLGFIGYVRGKKGVARGPDYLDRQVGALGFRV